MLTQKVFKAGNSKVVTIPSDLARHQGLEVGTEVILEPVEEGLLLRPAKKKEISPEFKRWLEQTGKKYRWALSELARR